MVVKTILFLEELLNYYLKITVALIQKLLSSDKRTILLSIRA